MIPSSRRGKELVSLSAWSVSARFCVAHEGKATEVLLVARWVMFELGCAPEGVTHDRPSAASSSTEVDSAVRGRTTLLGALAPFSPSAVFSVTAAV